MFMHTKSTEPLNSDGAAWHGVHIPHAVENSDTWVFKHQPSFLHYVRGKV